MTCGPFYCLSGSAMMSMNCAAYTHQACSLFCDAQSLTSCPVQGFISQPCTMQQIVHLQGPVEGRLYTCMTCARLQLCSGCFEAGKHPQHSFSCCAHPGAPDQPAQRDLQARLLTGLTCRCDSSVSKYLYALLMHCHHPECCQMCSTSFCNECKCL